MLVITVGLLWFAPPQVAPTAPVQVTLTDGSRVCGTLAPAAAAGTTWLRRASDGIVVPIPLTEITALTAVAGCLPGRTGRPPRRFRPGNGILGAGSAGG